MACSHLSLAGYYKLLSNLHRYHKYPIDVVENMMPYERDLFVDIILAEEAEEQK